jgi:hypothetical protein
MKKPLLRLLRQAARIGLGFYYSLPLQLLINQVRSHPIILSFWLFMFLVVNGGLLRGMGSYYMLIEPDYMGVVNFWSLFLMGIALGIFTLAYQMTCYILDGYQHYYLILVRRPFLKFAYNNSLIPTAFWLNYVIRFNMFHADGVLLSDVERWYCISGLLLGGFLVTTLSITYFSATNVDLVGLLSKTLSTELRNPRVIIRKARHVAQHFEHRVDYFINGPFSIQRVDDNAPVDFRAVVTALRQNHRNAIFAQLAIFLLILLLGVFQDYPQAHIPAAGSFILVFAFVVMLVGAVTFWFRTVGLLTVVGLLLVTVMVAGRFQIFASRPMAYGLDYTQPSVPYTYDHLRTLTYDQRYRQDVDSTLQVLNQWLQNQRERYGPAHRPKIVLVAVSGGGNRAATWVLRCLQQADSITNGRLSDNMRLITGASGGMLAAAYWRDLLMIRAQNPDTNLYHPELVTRAGSDLLNPVMFNLVANAFIPSRRFQYGSNFYFNERGNAFERQLVANTQAFGQRCLGDYAQLEREAKVPMMIFTPAILNDARTLFISPLPISYMCTPFRFNRAYSNDLLGVEYRRLFAGHNADSIRYTTVLRMNASFPMVLPFIEMPTDPITKILDGGALDNFGINTSLRFLFVFRDWIVRNTSGVLLLTIRDTPQHEPLSPVFSNSVSAFFDGVGGTLSSLNKAKDYSNDDMMEYARFWFRGQLDVIELQYIPERVDDGASLNFHITERERNDIIKSIYRSPNDVSFEVLKQILGTAPNPKP